MNWKWLGNAVLILGRLIWLRWKLQWRRSKN